MNRRGFVLACCGVALSMTTMIAQESKSKTDAITGTWAGQLVTPNSPDPTAVTLKLKFDGKSAVTGTMDGMPNPGDVKSGTFDPKTRALRLQLGIVGDSTVLLVFDGTVEKDKASGKISGQGTGTFSLTKKS